MSDKVFTRDDAATVVANRLGIAPGAARVLVGGMGDQAVQTIKALNAGPRPDLTIRVLVDEWANAQQPPQETEVAHVLRKDGTWGDAPAKEIEDTP